eukprot:Polyplicarium_translucidae@DN2818_c0_g1_i7.p1
MYARIDREMDVIRFAWSGTLADPWELAERYLHDNYALMEIRNGELHVAKHVETGRRLRSVFRKYWRSMNFATNLADMRFVMNILDEPRVAVNSCFQEAYKQNDKRLLANCTDSEPLTGQGVRTAEYLLDSCPDVVAENEDSHGFFMGAVDVGIARPRLPIPVFSFSKIDGCFHDITAPARFHKNLVEKTNKPPPFEAKSDRVYWRGADSGVRSLDADVASRSHRFRLVEFALKNRHTPGIPELDIAFSHMSRNPHLKGIYKRGRFKGGVRGRVTDRKFANFKYNIVVDGNSASMSEFSFFRGNSIILWDSLFVSYCTDWFTPRVDYHPVRADMSDFTEVLQALVQSEDHAARAAAGRALKSEELRVRRRISWGSVVPCLSPHVLCVD